MGENETTGYEVVAENADQVDQEAQAVAQAAAFDDVDVPEALVATTHDGKGDEEPGESDFQGYATDGVEKEHNQ